MYFVTDFVKALQHQTVCEWCLQDHAPGHQFKQSLRDPSLGYPLLTLLTLSRSVPDSKSFVCIALLLWPERGCCSDADSLNCRNLPGYVVLIVLDLCFGHTAN